MIHIVHLYPKEMNIYGDTGNRIVLEKRLEWRGIPFTSHLVSVGDELPKKVDILIAGGGQDAAQDSLTRDLLKKRSRLGELADEGTAMLLVCGMYQLFGNRFVTHEGKEIPGLGILNIETIAGEKRLIGNTIVNKDGIGKLVGYENHSGRTYLAAGMKPFAEVVMGAGNNGEDGEEGVHYQNVIGTYMHGPLLSKNPDLADYVLGTALRRRGHNEQLSALDDSIELKARVIALTRPR